MRGIAAKAPFLGFSSPNRSKKLTFFTLSFIRSASRRTRASNFASISNGYHAFQDRCGARSGRDCRAAAASSPRRNLPLSVW